MAQAGCLSGTPRSKFTACSQRGYVPRTSCAVDRVCNLHGADRYLKLGDPGGALCCVQPERIGNPGWTLQRDREGMAGMQQSEYEYDLLVIGSGPAGQRAAIQA